MLIPIFVDGDFEDRESVKDYFGNWICEGMYVNDSSSPNSKCRQGWITEVIDEKNGIGKIKVQIVWEENKELDEHSYYVTEFEPGNDWCKVIVDG